MRKWIIRIVVVVAILTPAIGVLVWWRDHYANQTKTYTVSRGDMLAGVTVSGTIRCKQRVAVAAEVLASVETLPVAEGQRVKSGELLIKLDDSVLVAECNKARARVEYARLKLAELEAPARKQDITRAQAEVKKAQSDLEYTKKEYERLLSLAGRAATESEVSAAANLYERSSSELASTRAYLELLKLGARSKHIAPARVEVSLARADLERCEALRSKHELRSPCDGIVTVRYVNRGEIVSPGQVLLHVENTDDVEVRAQVQESQLEGVQLGATARVVVDSYPSTPLKATVSQILPRVDPQQGTVTVLLTLDERPSVTLMDGMAVDIAIIDKELKNVIRVPVSSVHEGDEEVVTWVRDGSSFIKRDVQTGINDGHWVEIKSGLDEGDKIRLR